MGQFKPMVKMMTTEPSVELKLKKGGHVNMKKGGKAEAGHKKMAGGGMSAMGALAGTPALIGRPAVNAPVMAPGKPSMAMRRKAMMARATTPSGPPMAAPAMKEGGKSDLAQDKAMIKKAFKQHDMQEHKGGKGTALKLKKGGKYATGGAIPSEESYGDYDTTKVYQAKRDTANGTGGVKEGNGGGFKRGGKVMRKATGGAIPSETSYGNYDKTKVYSAKADRANGTGGVKDGNGGGYKTGGVAESNGGGYKKGGATKKHFATGGTVDSGRAVAMPQGRKPVPSSVKISQLAGTYKNGGRATPAEARLLKNNAAENATAMREAKTDSNLKYGSSKRMAGGGLSDKDRKTVEDLSGGAYDRTGKVNRDLEDALNPLSMVKELVGKARNAFSGTMSDKDRDMMRNATPPVGGVTKTKESVTVAPVGRKRGGRAC